MTELEIKELVRKRDDDRCVYCDMTEWEHQEIYGRKLHVHRRNPEGEYSLENCETVCMDCHGCLPKRPKPPRGKAPVLTTMEAATELGITRRHMLRLILAGDVKGKRLGRDWLIDPKSLRGWRRQRRPKGRIATR